jgi:hypothetical protein
MSTSSSLNWEQINLAVAKLRNDFRLKQNIDFCLCMKYGQLFVLTDEVYKDIVSSTLKEFILEDPACIFTY